jgi:cobalt/nickel transport system permease protein
MKYIDEQAGNSLNEEAKQLGRQIGELIKKVKQKLSVKLIPFMGMASAFSFLIMMFNIPVPGGTTGHVVCASVIAIILGPWAAVVSVSVALVIQSLVFGDGGVTAIGANCFNMAVVMPFVSYYVLKWINGKFIGGKRTYLASFLAGYVGINVTAIMAAILFGIQPLIASTPQGQPLYAPYGLEIALPAMMLEHLLIFGFIEGFVTAMLLKYFIKNEPELIYSPTSRVTLRAGTHLLKYSGEDNFSEIKPLFSATLNFSENTSLTLGSLSGSDSHKLFDPHFNSERLYNEYLEDGLQFLSSTDNPLECIMYYWR